MNRVLVIEDEGLIRENLLELLEAEGFEAEGAGDGKAGVAAALARPPSIVVCDITMPVMDGHQVLRTLRDYPETAAVPFIFLTARAQRADVREGMALGADDYITKPFTRDELLASIRGRLARVHAFTRAPATASTDMVIRSDAMTRVWERASRAARSDLAVLLLGETGVGKDVMAHAIHKASPRASRPFVPLNCAALAPTLLESELFGYDKGAFTGAVLSRPGLFETAEGGTVFLDEIGDLPPDVQVKLLRVLEDRRMTRVGGRVPREVDLRFVAATNRDLRADIAAGTFRRDLYFRLAGVVVEVPPLRERRAEIVPLAERFIDNMCRRMQRSPLPLTAAAAAVLQAWTWPGNVRELRNVVEQAVAMTDGASIDVADLPHLGGAPELGGLKDELRAIERQRIVDALEEYAGNQTQAARSLGVSRRTFLNRLDEFGLPRPRRKE